MSLESSVFKKIFYLINNPALVISQNFVIIEANHAAVEFLEYEDRESLLGTHISEIVVDNDILEEVSEKILNDEQWMGETELVTQDGRVLFGLGNATPITIDGSETIIVGVFTNLTERQRHIHSLKILNRVLTHNIRNDINIVWGYTEQIAVQSTDSSIKSYLDRIRDRLENIVSKANTAKELEFLVNQRDAAVLTTIDPCDILEEVILRSESRYSAATFDYPDEFDSVEVVANKTISRVFEDVIDNAVQHNDSSEPRVRISQTVDDKSMTISISDNGPGIDPTFEDQIFGREEYDNLHHGEGLSLFFADQVMRICGGDIWFESNEPRGTVFHIRFKRKTE